MLVLTTWLAQASVAQTDTSIAHVGNTGTPFVVGALEAGIYDVNVLRGDRKAALEKHWTSSLDGITRVGGGRRRLASCNTPLYESALTGTDTDGWNLWGVSCTLPADIVVSGEWRGTNNKN